MELQEIVDTTESQSRESTLSTRAYEVLRNWGATDDLIDQLDTLVGNYEGMYQNCPTKVEDLAQHPIYYTIDPETEKIRLGIPRALNSVMSPHGGQCRDISVGITFDMYVSGLGEKLFRCGIDFSHVSGYAPAFFVKENDWAHSYSILRKRSSKNHEYIIIDPSFQAVTSSNDFAENGGYVHKEVITNNIFRELNITLPSLANIPLAGTKDKLLSIMESEIHDFGQYNLILGLSECKTQCFSLGFVSDWDESKLKLLPFIMCTEASGNSSHLAILIGNKTVMMSAPGQNLSLECLQELDQILKSASKFSYTYTSDIKPYEADSITTIMTGSLKRKKWWSILRTK